MTDNRWVRLLAYVTGLVNQKLLLHNEYLVAENRILRSHLPKRLRLSNPDRSTLAEIGNRIGRRALSEVAIVAKPETILAWYRLPLLKSSPATLESSPSAAFVFHAGRVCGFRRASASNRTGFRQFIRDV